MSFLLVILWSASANGRSASNRRHTPAPTSRALYHPDPPTGEKMVAEVVVATFAALSVTLSLPFYLYGAWYALDTEVMTWDRLIYHLTFVVTGLALTTVPVVGWMLPRLAEQVSGLAMLHAFLGLQAYALLAFGLTGIVRIFQAKRQANLYRDPDPTADIDELHEHMAAWRFRLRVGVFGYVGFWCLAYVVGVYRYLSDYGFL